MPRLESRLRSSYLGDSDKPVSQGSVVGEALRRVADYSSRWITPGKTARSRESLAAWSV